MEQDVVSFREVEGQVGAVRIQVDDDAASEPALRSELFRQLLRLLVRCGGEDAEGQQAGEGDDAFDHEMKSCDGE